MIIKVSIISDDRKVIYEGYSSPLTHLRCNLPCPYEENGIVLDGFILIPKVFFPENSVQEEY